MRNKDATQPYEAVIGSAVDVIKSITSRVRKNRLKFASPGNPLDATDSSKAISNVFQICAAQLFPDLTPYECADCRERLAMNVGYLRILRGVADDEQQKRFFVRGAAEDSI